MSQLKSQKIVGLSLGLVLIGGALLPLVSATVGEAATFYSSSAKAVRTPPCRRPDGTRGECQSASPSPSPSRSSSPSPSRSSSPSRSY